MMSKVTIQVCEAATESVSDLICQAYRDGEQGILDWSDTDTRLSCDSETLEDIVSSRQLITAVDADQKLVGCVRLQPSEDGTTGNIYIFNTTQQSYTMCEYNLDQPINSIRPNNLSKWKICNTVLPRLKCPNGS